MSDVQANVLLDANGEDLTIQHVQDVEPFVESAKESRKEEQRSDWGRHTHRIPEIEIVKMLDEAAARGHDVRYLSKEFDELFKRKIRSGDWEAYRVDRPALLMGWMGMGS